ncbi:MAG: hypothetical protein K9K93_03670 [Acholeplasmataceae bacterium]|nr:hypothetical protein [Acholeplasmataceae bacterium]
MKAVLKPLLLVLFLGLILTIAACTDDDDDDPIVIDSVNVLGEFADGGDGVYTADINSANALAFSFAKSTFAWAAISKDVSADDFSDMKTLNISLTGSGVALLIKLESEDGTLSREVQINANQTVAEFAWDFEGDEAFLEVLGTVLIFAAPGQTEVTGNVLISELEFVKTAAEGNVITDGYSDFVVPDPNIYDGEADTFTVINFYDGGDAVYDITEDGGAYDVTYEKTSDAQHWSYFSADLQGAFSHFAQLVFVMTGEVDQTALLKVEGPQGNKELPVVFDGTEQTFVIDLLQLTESALDALNKIVLFGSQGNIGSGSFTLHSVTFKTARTDVNTGWTNVDGLYTMTEQADGSVDVEYNKVANAWSNIVLAIPEAYQGYNKLEVVIQGTAGQNFIVKPNDNGALEQNITLEDSEPLTLNFSNDGFTNIVLFAAPGVDDASGTFKIVSVFVDFEPATFDPTFTVDFNSDWQFNANYEFVYEDGSTTVTYYQSGWDHMYRRFDVAEVAGLNTMTVTILGTAGKKVLVKPNDSGATETWMEFTEENLTQTLVFNFEGGFSSLFLFGEGGEAGAIGTFTILETTLSYTHHIAGWQSINGYTVVEEDGVASFDYDKGGNGWAFSRVDFDALEVAGLNTLTLSLTGVVGESVLIKPNDQGALEKTVTFVDENPVTVTVTADHFNTIIIFGQPGDGAAVSSFQIVEATLTYVPIAFDPDKVLDINVNHISGDPGIYVFTAGAEGFDVTYDKVAGQEWSFMRMNIDQEEAMGLNTLTLVLSGTVGKSILIKPNDDGALEQTVTFESEEPVTITVTADQFLSVLMFADPNVAPATGAFTIVSAELSYVEPTE